MRDGIIAGVDPTRLAADVQAAQASLLARVVDQNPERRSARDLSPAELDPW
jgi:hypothetical protein